MEHISNEILDLLKTPVQKSGKRSPSTPKRKINIDWIAALQREGLAYGKMEKQLLIHTTQAGEKIFIQYPGKESQEERKSIRPWDFRPEFYLSDGTRVENMRSFFDIWEVIFETAENLAKKTNKESLRLFACLLYRMACMLDHKEVAEFKTSVRQAKYNETGQYEFGKTRGISLPVFFKYSPNSRVVNYIESKCRLWGGMSLEGFLFYNEALAWNEDCKYYYRNHNERAMDKWINKTGRINTLFTHIRILGYTVGEVKLSKIFAGFVRGKGVAPASDDEIRQICHGLVV